MSRKAQTKTPSFAPPTAYDIDPFKDYYPFKEGSILNLVCATGLGYPLREEVTPEAVFNTDDHAAFARACGRHGLNWELVAKEMGRPQWTIAAYWEFLEYVMGNRFVAGHIEYFKSCGFSQKEVNYTLGLLYGLVLEGKWERRFAKLWDAMLEVEANGGKIPDHIRAKFSSMYQKSASAQSAAAASSSSSSSSRKKKTGSTKKAAKKARKSTGAAVKAAAGGMGGQSAAEKQSIYQGVIWRKDREVWYARLIKGGQFVLNERFDDEKAAARAYDRAARLHVGPNAIVNFASDESDVFLNPKAGAVRYGGVDGTVTSDYRGVDWFQGSKWRAKICVGGKQRYLGSYDTPLEAAKAYDDAARKLHGKKAKPNYDEQGNRTDARCLVMNDGKQKVAPTAANAASALSTAAASRSSASAGVSSMVDGGDDDDGDEEWVSMPNEKAPAEDQHHHEEKCADDDDGDYDDLWEAI